MQIKLTWEEFIARALKDIAIEFPRIVLAPDKVEFKRVREAEGETDIWETPDNVYIHLESYE